MPVKISTRLPLTTHKSSWLHLMSENAKALFCIVFKLPKIAVNNGKKLGQNTKNELRIV